MIYGIYMDNFLWWIVLVVTIICMVLIPGLINMLIEAIKEYKRNKDE